MPSAYQRRVNLNSIGALPHLPKQGTAQRVEHNPGLVVDRAIVAGEEVFLLAAQLHKAQLDLKRPVAQVEMARTPLAAEQSAQCMVLYSEDNRFDLLS
jgi:hypothetical protein